MVRSLWISVASTVSLLVAYASSTEPVIRLVGCIRQPLIKTESSSVCQKGLSFNVRLFSSGASHRNAELGLISSTPTAYMIQKYYLADRKANVVRKLFSRVLLRLLATSLMGVIRSGSGRNDGKALLIIASGGIQDPVEEVEGALDNGSGRSAWIGCVILLCRNPDLHVVGSLSNHYPLY